MGKLSLASSTTSDTPWYQYVIMPVTSTRSGGAMARSFAPVSSLDKP